MSLGFVDLSKFLELHIPDFRKARIPRIRPLLVQQVLEQGTELLLEELVHCIRHPSRCADSATRA